MKKMSGQPQETETETEGNEIVGFSNITSPKPTEVPTKKEKKSTKKNWDRRSLNGG